MKLPLKAKVVVYDVDGTLVEPVPYICCVVRDILIDLNRPIADTFEFIRGIGVETFQETVTRLYGPELVNPFREGYNKVYKKYGYLIKPYAGIRESLERLQDMGFEFGILANKRRYSIIHSLESAGLLKFFGENSMIGLDDGYGQKPNPAGLLELGRRTKTKPQEMIMMGDTTLDMRAGISSGAQIAGVLTGVHNLQDFLELDYNVLVLQSATELPDYATKE